MLASVILALPTSAMASAASQLHGYFPSNISCVADGVCTIAGSLQFTSGTTQSYQGLMTTEAGGVARVATTVQLPANASTSNPYVVFGPWGCQFGLGVNCFTTASFTQPVTDISCASSGNCTAVGSYVDTDGDIAGLLLTETGGVWAQGIEAQIPSALASLPQGQHNQLRFVSVQCVSAGNCSAIANVSAFTGSPLSPVAGTYASAGRTEPVAFTETGGVWSPGQELQTPADTESFGSNSIDSLSCSAEDDCVAVGDYSSPRGSWGFAVSETNGVWGSGGAVVGPTEPDGVTGARLDAVSCTGVGECTAVGSVGIDVLNSGSYEEPLAVTETNGAWGTASTLNQPANALPIAQAQMETGLGVTIALDSLSCSSAGNCDAAGGYADDNGVAQGMFIEEVGGTWHQGVEAAPTISGDSVSVTQISCLSAGNCAGFGQQRSIIALGSGSYAGGAPSDVLLSEADGAWNTTDAPHPSGMSEPTMLSISCAAPGGCDATGVWSLMPFTIHLGRSGWTQAVQTHAPPTQAQLLAAVRSLLSTDGRLARSGSTGPHPAPTAVTRRFTALESGRILVRWYARVGRRRILTAQASATAASAESIKLHLRPSAAGRKLLTKHRALKISDQVSFTPTGLATVSAVATFRLPRRR